MEIRKHNNLELGIKINFFIDYFECTSAELGINQSLR